MTSNLVQKIWIGLLWADASPWAGVKEEGVQNRDFGYEPPAMTCLHPSELERKSGHKPFHLKIVYINN